MDDIQLRDEAAQDRVRTATEFLDPSEFSQGMVAVEAFYLITYSFRRCPSTQVRLLTVIIRIVYLTL